MLNFLRQSIGLTNPFRVAYHKTRAIIASKLALEPSKDMVIIGITGTKGKTTVSNLVTHGLIAAGKKVAMFSTATLYLPSTGMTTNEYKMTSPDPFILQNFLRKAKSEGCEYAVVETSSHALYYGRVTGVHYDVACLTNISQDHLDLHGTMEHYVQTKLKLFESLVWSQRKGDIKKVSVINVDAEYAGKFLQTTADTIYTYGLSMSAQMRAENIVSDRGGTTFTVRMPSSTITIRTRLMGEFNVLNTLAAIAILISQKVPIEKLPDIFSQFMGVAGRMEYVPNNQWLQIYIDYAHTEASLRAVLTTLRESMDGGRIITVFGATGERDRDKRPKMGKVVHELSDAIVLTDDDTYGENSWQIIWEVMKGIPRKEGENFWVIPSREDAIRTAIVMARPGDTLVIAGKWAETVMVTNSGPVPWSDKSMTQLILEEIEGSVRPRIGK